MPLSSAQIQYAARDAATPVHILDYFTGIDFPALPAGPSLSLHALLQNVSTLCWHERFPHFGLSDVGILFDGVWYLGDKDMLYLRFLVYRNCTGWWFSA
jgi:hypothetical protein